jgi:hypothetical protein
MPLLLRESLGLCLVTALSPIGCSAGTGTSTGASGSGAAAGFGGVFGSGGGVASGGASVAPPGSGGAASAAGGAAPGSGGASGSGGLITTVVGTGGSPYDPSVTFDWPESSGDAGAASHCKAGHYVGTFQCNYVAAGSVDGSAGFPLNGPIDMHLDQGTSGEFLTVSGGKLTGATGLAIVFNADVVGQLDCGSGAFTGSLQNGVYNFFIFPGGNFAGPFNGTFHSGATPTLSGTWQLQTGGSNTGSCNGTWTVSWSAT